MWAACVDAGLSFSFHIGSGNLVEVTDAAKIAVMPPATGLGYGAVPLMMDAGKHMLDLLLSGVLVKFPTLQFVSVESGCGWAHFIVEAADYHFKKGKMGMSSHPWGDLLPSDLFRRQCFVTTWFEHLSQEAVEPIQDNILFETDFPHRTCLERPDVDHAIDVLLGDLKPDTKEKIMWRNAARLYRVPGLSA
jgi:predicted TIM-barrel fold metal-dependent hydrolase